LIAATPDQRPALERAATLFTEEDLTRFFQILLQTDEDLRRKLDPRVHLEMGLLRLINAARLAPLEELIAEVRSGAPSSSSGGPTRLAPPSPISSATPKRELPSSLASPSPFAPPPRASAAAAGASSSPQPVPFRPAERAPQSSSSVFAAPAPVSAPAPAPARAVAAAPAEDVEEASESSDNSAKTIPASGLSEEQIAEIKSAIQSQQKFLGELLEHAHRWELEGAELRIYFPTSDRTYAEMIEGRDSIEKIRSISSKVLGRPVRVCAKLESVAATAVSASRGSASQDLRDQFERDPVVKSMMQRFGGKITEVKRNHEES
jgi:DNA polymerase-3 subunit gamma/tau